MESPPLRTIEGPDLNFDAYDGTPSHSYEALRAGYESLRDRRQKGLQAGYVYDDQEIDRLAREGSRVKSPDEPRVRVRFAPDGYVWHRRRRDGRQVAHRTGVVELANLNGFHFDYRVAFEVVAPPQPPGFRVVAACPLARQGGPPVTVAKAFKGMGEIIRQASRHLTIEVAPDDQEGPPRRRLDARLAADVLNFQPPDEPRPRRRRRPSVVVDQEAERVAELYARWNREAQGGPYARWVAQQMGWGGEARTGEDRVRARLSRAQQMSLDVPAAVSTRSRR